MRLSYKLILAFLLVTLLPVVFLAQVGVEKIEEFGTKVIENSRTSIQAASRKAVVQKATDVAAQVEIYLRSKPRRGIDALHADPYLRQLAVQPVGDTGYTALHRRDGTVFFHRQQRLEGSNLLVGGPANDRFFADFTRLFERSLNADEPVQGYYQWLEKDQMIRKFMAVTPVGDSGFLLAATIPAAEFEKAMVGFEGKVTALKHELRLFVFVIAGVILGVAIIGGFAVSVSFTRPIGRLQKGLMAFARGDLLYRIPVKTRDELGTLSLMFNQMAEEIAQKNTQLQEKRCDLEKSESRYRQLVENLHDVVAFIDPGGTTHFISPGVTEYLGYRPDDLVGKAILDLAHPEDADYAQAQIRRAIKAGERTTQVEARLRSKSGEWRTMNIRASFLYDDGKPAGTVAVAHDVTGERKMASKVRLLSLAVEQLGDGIMVCNLEGNVIVANPAWARVHGFSGSDELVERNIYAFHPDQEEMLLQDIMQAVLVDRRWSGEVRHRRKDGSTFLSLSVYSLLQDDRGRNIGYVVVATDITERKRKEETLRQYSDDLEVTVQQRTRELQEKADQLEEAMRQARDADSLKTEFLTRVSHELRTPLNSIVGFSNLLLRSGENELPERQRFDVELIHQNSLYLLDLINGILDLSKIESGVMEVERTEFDLAELAEETLRTLQPVADLSRIELVNRLAGRRVPIHADREKCRQILFNLLSNALKFTQGGVVEIADIQTPDMLTIAVRDTGIGIASSDLERAFDRFVQFASPVHGRFHGTGLGLTIARSFVEMHGGRLRAESQVGVGSTFYADIPKTKSPVDSPSSAPEEGAS